MGKIKTVGTISEFMNGKHKEKKKVGLNGSRLEKLVWVPIAGLSVTVMSKVNDVLAATDSISAAAIPASATSDAIANQVVHAFDPLVELMVGLSLPIASVIITGAALLIMMNRSDIGYPMMMRASMGYVLVQMVPLFIKLLVGVGAAI